MKNKCICKEHHLILPTPRASAPAVVAHTPVTTLGALSASNGARSHLLSAGSLHPAGCHHQGRVHGLLFPGRQDLAAPLSAQPLWQWLLEVARLVSFSDDLASSWFAQCRISRALGVPGLLCQKRLVYNL